MTEPRILENPLFDEWVRVMTPYLQRMRSGWLGRWGKDDFELDPVLGELVVERFIARAATRTLSNVVFEEVNRARGQTERA